MSCGRILIIDDDELVRKSLSEFLTAEGYEVQCAAEGDQGLRLLNEFAPDMVFLDIYMPGWSGLDVIRRVRQVNRVIPVIMITGYDNPQIARDLVLAGATDFIKKPWKLPYVLRVVEACMAKRTPRQRARDDDASRIEDAVDTEEKQNE